MQKSQLLDVSSFMVPCFPPHYHVFELFENRYSQQVRSFIIDKLGDTHRREYDQCVLLRVLDAGC